MIVHLPKEKGINHFLGHSLEKTDPGMGHTPDSKAPCRAPNFIAKVVRKRIILIRITWQGKSFPPVKPNPAGNTLIMKGSLQAEPFAQDIDFILAQLTQVKLGRTAHAGHCLLAYILPLGIVLMNRSSNIAPNSPYNERLLASAAPRAQQPERGSGPQAGCFRSLPTPRQSETHNERLCYRKWLMFFP